MPKETVQPGVPHFPKQHSSASRLLWGGGGGRSSCPMPVSGVWRETDHTLVPPAERQSPHLAGQGQVLTGYIKLGTPGGGGTGHLAFLSATCAQGPQLGGKGRRGASGSDAARAPSTAPTVCQALRSLCALRSLTLPTAHEVLATPLHRQGSWGTAQSRSWP